MQLVRYAEHDANLFSIRAAPAEFYSQQMQHRGFAPETLAERWSVAPDTFVIPGLPFPIFPNVPLVPDLRSALFGCYSALWLRGHRAVMLAADMRARYGEEWQKPSELFENEAPKAFRKFPETDESRDEKVAGQARAGSSHVGLEDG